ncbi:Arm DNA-binding domain-containing protein [Thiotrichales bacterium 19X7-9]|nr:Arm DNA-binding domain-containing protein [Thiotrichales bacterium 19X7-9]
MPKIKLTKTSISELKADSNIIDYFDTEVKGLVLRLFPSGTKVFSIIYRNNENKLRRYTIGKYPSIPLLQAKREAQRLLLKISQGEDIQKKKSLARHDQGIEEYTFKNYLDEFYADWCRKNRKDAKRILLTLFNACEPLHEVALKSFDHSIINHFLVKYQKKKMFQIVELIEY